MSDQDLDKLDPELRALLDGEASYTDMPEDAPAKLFAKVSVGLGLPTGGGPGDGGGSGSHGSGNGGNSTSGGSGNVGGAAGSAAGHLATQTVWSVAKQTATLIAFGTGAVVGVAGHAAYERVTEPARPENSVVTVAPPVPMPIVAASVSAAPSASASVVVSAVPSAIPTFAAQRPAPADDLSEDQDLGAERAQLEIARTALARGQAAAALTTLQSDVAKRPKSRLAEERESMMVQALALAGQTDEAKTRAARFRRKYPKSLFLPVIDAVVPMTEGRDR